jgi:hypothetical protein
VKINWHPVRVFGRMDFISLFTVEHFARAWARLLDEIAIIKFLTESR